ncbi:Uncharacterized protein OBRU01_07106 [Operophtera brumata]|uniref:Uncharacterized protein n=1 Tax=Operophtera brumata TaxID=104452 RepID=A0A0L7LJS1_OPEBR|nr:Uncharacterized protein OBRU01_07106 [Operophtera brumata]
MEKKGNKKQQRDYLFDIIIEIKQFYETPIVYVTKRDYADTLFNTMCTLRTNLQSEESKDKVIDIIVDYHLQWLHAVKEIETYKNLINDISKEEISEAIRYTIDALAARLKYFERYMEKNRQSLSNSDQAYLDAELEIVKDMHDEVTTALLEKLKCYGSFVGDIEFTVKLNQTTDELLDWLDKIYDSLSYQVSKYVSLNVPNLTSDLTKTLKQIVYEINVSQALSAIKMLDDLKQQGNKISSMILCTTAHSLEISKVVEKIDILDDRITRLESEPTSAAVMDLANKKEYLEKRLISLENLKMTITSLHNLAEIELEGINEEEVCVCEDFYRFRIFNHFLPLDRRERLITDLCYVWDMAIFGEQQSRKSMISLLSADDMREEFTDDLGTFYIDEHSRKIYKMPEDGVLYQPNELNELVPLSDDDDHIYFYDECGRYYIDPITRQRVYKAHGTASEYMMDSKGVLLKFKEERDGVTYFYDSFGRYFIDENGKQIYREADTVSEYERDELGNLVRIRSHLDIFDLCPKDANVTEDFKYLRQTVGTALRVSIADCVLHLPDDPIKYLSNSLRKYKENMEIKEKRATEQEQLNIERNLIALAEKRAAAEKYAMEAALRTQGGSEASYDSNMQRYMSMNPDDTISVASVK